MSSPLDILPENNDDPWYKQGLRFECTGCGRCCTGAPGIVRVSEEEIHAMANFLKLSLEDFGRHYLRLVNGLYALVEKNVTFNEYDCVFLKDKKCSIYPVRPTQCRTFPWWKHNLTSKANWDEAARYCEGISETAPVIPHSEIKKQLT